MFLFSVHDEFGYTPVDILHRDLIVYDIFCAKKLILSLDKMIIFVMCMSEDSFYDFSSFFKINSCEFYNSCVHFFVLILEKS